MSSTLEVLESLQYQGVDEIIAYSITTTKWVSSPTSPTVVAYDESTMADVTTTVFPVNSPSVSGDVISLSVLKSLTKGHTYRIEVKFVVGTSTYECHFRVKAVK